MIPLKVKQGLLINNRNNLLESYSLLRGSCLFFRMRLLVSFDTRYNIIEIHNRKHINPTFPWWWTYTTKPTVWGSANTSSSKGSVASWFWAITISYRWPVIYSCYTMIQRMGRHMSSTLQQFRDEKNKRQTFRQISDKLAGLAKAAEMKYTVCGTSPTFNVPTKIWFFSPEITTILT